jgi:hypothetical protein
MRRTAKRTGVRLADSGAMVRNIRRRRIIDTVRDYEPQFGGAAPHDIGVADAPRLVNRQFTRGSRTHTLPHSN